MNARAANLARLYLLIEMKTAKVTDFYSLSKFNSRYLISPR